MALGQGPANKVPSVQQTETPGTGWLRHSLLPLGQQCCSGFSVIGTMSRGLGGYKAIWKLSLGPRWTCGEAKPYCWLADTAILSPTRLHQRFIIPNSKPQPTRGICPSPQQGIACKVCLSALELSTVLQKAVEPPLWSSLLRPPCYARTQSSRSEHETGDTFNFKRLSHFSEV